MNSRESTTQLSRPVIKEQKKLATLNKISSLPICYKLEISFIYSLKIELALPVTLRMSNKIRLIRVLVSGLKTLCGMGLILKNCMYSLSK